MRFLEITKYYLSSIRFTIQVNVDEDNKIVWTAPIASKFINQDFKNLVRWSKADVVEEIK